MSECRTIVTFNKLTTVGGLGHYDLLTTVGGLGHWGWDRWESIGNPWRATRGPTR